MAEYMFLGMRMMSGVSISMFRQLFGTDMMNVYREPIDKHIKEGLYIWAMTGYGLQRRALT